MKNLLYFLQRFLKRKNASPAYAPLDAKVRDLFNIIHFTEEITSKLHASLPKEKIIDIVTAELHNLTNNPAAIFIIDDSRKWAKTSTHTMPSAIVKTLEKKLNVTTAQVDLENSVVFRRLLDNQETYCVKSIELYREIIHGPLSYVIAGITGHLHATTAVSPLTVNGRLIGIFAIDSHEMADVFLLSVKNLAQHISAALERAEENEKRDLLEKELQQKEASIRSIFMAAPVGIAVMGKDRKILAVNRHTLDVTGYSEEEFLESSTRLFFENDNEFERVGRELYYEHDGKKRKTVETQIRCKNGMTVDVLLTSAPIEGTDRTIVTLTDITERKVTERILMESERKFREMFEITSEGVALQDPATGRFIAANPAMCALFGYSEEELLSLTPEDITPKEAKEIMHDAMKRLAESGDVPDHEGISVRKDGSKINVIVSNHTMSWDGKPVNHITFKDITSLKETQEQLRKKNQEILEFTNTVTHDLRKPLTAMKIIFDLAKNGALGMCNEEGTEAVNTGVEAANYMREMLEDLLACARLETGTQELAIEKTGFRELVDTVIARLKYQIEEKDITVEKTDEDIVVNADKKQLTRVFMNLVGNAVNYIGEGSDKRIRIGWKRRNGTPLFYVEDNGMGIPPESKQNLFDKFKRGSNVSGIQGTGLGLAIVKGTVEAHGGKIWFESENGSGTTFYFSLQNDTHEAKQVQGEGIMFSRLSQQVNRARK